MEMEFTKTNNPNIIFKSMRNIYNEYRTNGTILDSKSLNIYKRTKYFKNFNHIDDKNHAEYLSDDISSNNSRSILKFDI